MYLGLNKYLKLKGCQQFLLFSTWFIWEEIKYCFMIPLNISHGNVVLHVLSWTTIPSPPPPPKAFAENLFYSLTVSALGSFCYLYMCIKENQNASKIGIKGYYSLFSSVTFVTLQRRLQSQRFCLSPIKTDECW